MRVRHAPDVLKQRRIEHLPHGSVITADAASQPTGDKARPSSLTRLAATSRIANRRRAREWIRQPKLDRRTILPSRDNPRRHQPGTKISNPLVAPAPRTGQRPPSRTRRGDGKNGAQTCSPELRVCAPLYVVAVVLSACHRGPAVGGDRGAARERRLGQSRADASRWFGAADPPLIRDELGVSANAQEHGVSLDGIHLSLLVCHAVFGLFQLASLLLSSVSMRVFASQSTYCVWGQP
jgi:hypothetical protein